MAPPNLGILVLVSIFHSAFGSTGRATQYILQTFYISVRYTQGGLSKPKLYAPDLRLADCVEITQPDSNSGTNEGATRFNRRKRAAPSVVHHVHINYHASLRLVPNKRIFV